MPVTPAEPQNAYCSNQWQQDVTADLHLLYTETANNCQLYLFEDHRFVFKQLFQW